MSSRVALPTVPPNPPSLLPLPVPQDPFPSARTSVERAVQRPPPPPEELPSAQSTSPVTRQGSDRSEASTTTLIKMVSTLIQAPFSSPVWAILNVAPSSSSFLLLCSRFSYPPPLKTSGQLHEFHCARSPRAVNSIYFHLFQLSLGRPILSGKRHFSSPKDCSLNMFLMFLISVCVDVREGVPPCLLNAQNTQWDLSLL